MNSDDNKRKDNSEKLSEAQKKMLQQSEDDIKAGKLLSQKHVDEADLEWLKTLGVSSGKVTSSGSKICELNCPWLQPGDPGEILKRL